jgi:hypothetical protein
MLRFLVLFVLLAGCAQAPSQGPLNLNREIFRNGWKPLKSNMGIGPNETYLAMDINYGPVQKLREELEREQQIKLQHGGEAHLTVITPAEYQTLKRHLWMTDINTIAKRHYIQDSRFEVICLGKAQTKKELTYYLVVKSEDLVLIRQEIHKAFIKKGGERTAFDPKNWHPFISVGFQKRDFSVDEGFIKNEKSCVRQIKLTEY